MYHALKRWLCGAVLLASLGSCADQRAAGPAPEAPEPIRFGAPLGLSGPQAGQAALVRDALRVLEYQVNAAGGIGGRPLEILVIDDRGVIGLPLIQQVREELLERGVIALIGPQRSDQALSLVPQLRDRVPMISGTVMSESVSAALGGRAWLYRTLPEASAQAAAMVRFAVGGVNGAGGGCGVLGVLHAEDDYGRSLAGLIVDEYQALGSVEARQVSVKDDVAAALHDATVGTQLQCLALALYEAQALQLLDALLPLRAAQPGLFAADLKLIGSEQLHSGEWAQQAARALASDAAPPQSYVIAPQHKRANSSNDGWAPRDEVLALMRQIRPELPSLPSVAAASYDAGALLALARAAAGTDDAAAIRAAIEAISVGGTLSTPGHLDDSLRRARAGENINYDGASGTLEFNAAGVVNHTSFVIEKIGVSDFERVGYHEGGAQ